MNLYLLGSRLLAVFVFAIATFSAAPRGISAEPVETTLALSTDSPARLILAYWPSGGWLVRQSGRQVELVLPGVGLAISAGAVALPAGDGAITSLSTEIDKDATTLRIGLGCDCTLAVQGDGARLLIDVVGAGRIAGPVFREAALAPRLAPVPRPRHFGGAVAINEVGMDAVDGQHVGKTRTRLLEELRRAAEAGLVTLRPDAAGALSRDELARANNQTEEPDGKFQPRSGGVSEEVPENAPITAEGGVPEGGAADDGYPGASIIHAATPEEPVLAGTTAPGRPVGPPALPDAGSPPGGDWQAATARRVPPIDLVSAAPATACFGNEAFYLTDPVRHDALSGEIARLRQALIGEFDRGDVPTALSLARLYLAHGLGVEAMGILTEFAPDAPETGLLAALAWLAEGRPLPVPNILSISGCTGQHALWQALDAALASDNRKALEREAAAAGALEQMARGLRGQTAVRLGLAAIAEGDLIAAHRLNAMAKRSIAGDDREGQDLRHLLAARLSIGRGDMAAGVVRLKELRGARSQAGVEALLMLAELVADPANNISGQPDTLRIDLGAVAMAERDTPLGERAFLGEVDLTGQLFGRDAAFELLAYGYAGRIIGETTYRDALAAVGASLADRRSDMPLALIYEADPRRFAKALDDSGFRLALARSYLGLGAPSMAEALLRSGDIQSDVLLADLARAYLETGDAESAERLANRLPDGPGQAMIHAGVALAAGDAPAALAALNAAGGPASQRARTAWAAGDWPASVQALAEVISTGGSGAGAGTGLPEPGAATQPANQPANLAARLALAAYCAGYDAVPPEAASLAAAEPGLRSGLEAIFKPLVKDLAAATPAEVAVYLETVSAEARLFEELLEDG
jgi:hypothetical protein